MHCMQFDNTIPPNVSLLQRISLEIYIDVFFCVARLTFGHVFVPLRTAKQASRYFVD